MRRTGKTTRLIDFAIQHLFSTGELQLIKGKNVFHSNFVDLDHEEGNHAQENFISRVVTRLKYEHTDQCIFSKNTSGIIITLK